MAQQKAGMLSKLTLWFKLVICGNLYKRPYGVLDEALACCAGDLGSIFYSSAYDSRFIHEFFACPSMSS